MLGDQGCQLPILRGCPLLFANIWIDLHAENLIQLPGRVTPPRRWTGGLLLTRTGRNHKFRAQTHLVTPALGTLLSRATWYMHSDETPSVAMHFLHTQISGCVQQYVRARFTQIQGRFVIDKATGANWVISTSLQGCQPDERKLLRRTENVWHQAWNAYFHTP